jgi:hypothetical protein
VIAGEDREWLDDETWQDAPVRDVPLDELVATQEFVTDEKVESMAESVPDFDPIRVAITDGEFHISDGHHRATAAVIAGHDVIPSSIVPLDESAGGIIQNIITDFEQRLNEVPDDARHISDPSEAGEDEEIVEGDRGGLYAVPSDTDDSTNWDRIDIRFDGSNAPVGETAVVVRGYPDNDRVEGEIVEDEHGQKIVETGDGDNVWISDDDDVILKDVNPDSFDDGEIIDQGEIPTETSYSFADDVYQENGVRVSPENLAGGEMVEIVDTDGTRFMGYFESADTESGKYQFDMAGRNAPRSIAPEEVEAIYEVETSTERIGDTDVELGKVPDGAKERVVSHLTEMQSEYGALDDVATVTTADSAAPGNPIGQYNFEDNTLYFDITKVSPDRLGDAYQNDLRQSENVEQVLTHESIHAQHFSSIDDAQRQSMVDESVELDDSMVTEAVSEYATKNPAEFVAETGLAMEKGESLPAEIIEEYKRLGGPEEYQ